MRKLVEPLIRRFRRPGPDGFPIPPRDLRHLVSGIQDTPEQFVKASERLRHAVTSLLGRRNLKISDFSAVLDFGCGCGRILRNFHSVPGTRFYGTDYNPDLVQWCQENLPFAEFGVNQLEPPLSYPGGMFGFVYAFSVFTHLPVSLQIPWAQELWRVLEPGGYLHITVHGDECVKALLSEVQRERFDNGELIVVAEDRAGANQCTAFHPQQYVRSVLTAVGFEVLEFNYGRDFGDYIDHDMYLFRKCE